MSRSIKRCGTGSCPRSWDLRMREHSSGEG
jgi:hypothetical protein